MGSITLASASQLIPIQARVSGAARIDASYDSSTLTITSSALFDDDWTAALAAETAGDPVPSVGAHKHTVDDITGLENLAGQIIPIWAEENGALGANQYEWSWGNGATGASIGIPLAMDAELFAVSFNAETFGTSAAVIVRRNATDAHTATFASNNSVIDLATPVPFSKADRVSFRTSTLVGSTSDARICAWFKVV